MGWCSGTQVFDAVVGALLNEKVDKRAAIAFLINALEDMDWDCQSDSDYWDHPLIRDIFKARNPEWFEDAD